MHRYKILDHKIWILCSGRGSSLEAVWPVMTNNWQSKIYDDDTQLISFQTNEHYFSEYFRIFNN